MVTTESALSPAGHLLAELRHVRLPVVSGVTKEGGAKMGGEGANRPG